jgi:hypothetical protein
MKKYIFNLLEEKHIYIEQNNIKIIIENGLRFKINKKQEIIFKKDYIEIFEKEIIVGTYYYATDKKNRNTVAFKYKIFEN